MDKPDRPAHLAVIAALLLFGTAAQAKEAIVGGKPITIKEAPWQLLLLAEHGNGSTGNCAASWIGGKWVVTAGHCIEDPNLVETFAS